VNPNLNQPLPGINTGSVLDEQPVLTTPAPALPAPSPTPPSLRRFGDTATTRKLIFDNVLAAASAAEPVTNSRHSLHLSDVQWSGPEDFSIADQKKALLSQGTLARKLIGTYVMKDVNGNPIASRKTQLARVPYMTDRGTFILGGNEYTMSHQTRLMPGVFARKKQNDEYESHLNVSKGHGSRVFLDPATGVFRIQMGQAKIPLFPLLKAMGISDSQLRDAWGNELTASNMKQDSSQAITKLYSKLYKGKRPEGEDPREAVVRAFNEMETDPAVTKRTLGGEFRNAGPETMLAITKKLLRVSRGEEDPDDRDAMNYQTLLGPEDMFAERFKKAKGVARQMLWKASARGNLDSIPTNAYSDAVRAAIISSGLGMPLEEINPAEIFDQQYRVTRMGEGGIPSMDAVPDESRAVQPSQFGFIDILRTPESGKVGVDARIASAAMKGADGKIYTPVKTPAGETSYKTPQDLADSVLAFPNELKRGEPYVAALIGGKVRMVPREKVDFEIPDMESTFSPLGNMIPFKSMVKGQRAVMAARMLTQALPLTNAEAPLVQAGIPGQEGRSFEDEYAKHMGALHADRSGHVLGVTDDGIRVRYDDGSEKELPLYHNFPFNRKTFLHQNAAVKPGDAFGPGQLLASSNFTDKSGSTALGLNARVAYTSWRGLNFEDANVVSQSFARRAASEHMYQNQHEWEKGDHRGKNAFVSLFPAKYDRAMLARFDDDGVIKPGTRVKKDDPLILVARTKERNKKSLLQGGKPSYGDVSQTWDHHEDGIVTDVVHGEKGVSVVVKATMPIQVGDKMSGRYGDKGVVSHIIPDDEMPTDKDGKPFEVLLNPLGVISRTNAAQVIETALGKIAAMTGKPYKVPDFQDEDDLIEFGLKELQKHGLEDLESIIDPTNGRKVNNILAGNRWFMKLHHTSESKAQARGVGAYTSEMSPAKGGETGAKRIGMLQTNALLSHGATEVLRDAKMVRGQANPEYWTQYMSGFKPPTPKVPMVYHKFVDSLRASGVNVVRDGSRMHIMALTDHDIDQMAGDRELKNINTVDWKTMEPIKGGLFDQKLTGGHMTADGGGNRWSYIKLHRPMPNPAMEEPIRRVLGLTKKQLAETISGEHKLDGHTGPEALQRALGNMNIDKEIERARMEISSGKKTSRDDAVRRLGYLKSAKRLGIHPKDWMLTKAPVLPPAFRPISTMGAKKLPLIADPNYLYKELWDANQSLKDLSGQLDDEDLGQERLAVYNAFKAVTGLGDPTHPKNQERQVKGILKHVFGSSPKLGMVQRRLLSTTTDLVGRSVIAPDPNLDMDQAGVPENKAWEIYRLGVVRNLVRRGMSRVEAARKVEEKHPVARQAMLDEMDNGVLVISRDPALHRYSVMAVRPKLVKGDVLKISPLVVGGFGADFDGDAMSYHVPTTDEAKEEALEKMLPSRNLISAATLKPHFLPSQEYVGGLREASAAIDNKNKPLVFATVADAVRAYHNGQINVDRKVEILER
jgi:DNA-directed RNA polymerase beta subunit